AGAIINKEDSFTMAKALDEECRLQEKIKSNIKKIPAPLLCLMAGFFDAGFVGGMGACVAAIVCTLFLNAFELFPKSGNSVVGHIKHMSIIGGITSIVIVAGYAGSGLILQKREKRSQEIIDDLFFLVNIRQRMSGDSGLPLAQKGEAAKKLLYEYTDSTSVFQFIAGQIDKRVQNAEKDLSAKKIKENTAAMRQALHAAITELNPQEGPAGEQKTANGAPTHRDLMLQGLRPAEARSLYNTMRWNQRKL
ncbi:MAG: hypothetical protein AB7U41_02835, partial [Dongiaceae bacterium]